MSFQFCLFCKKGDLIRFYSKSIEENVLIKIPQGKIKFQTEKVRDRQRQRKNDREIEIES